MSQSSDIVLVCPGGKCPIKDMCWTPLRTGTIMPREPFNQTGIVVRCTYFELKPKDDKPVSTAAAETKVEPAKKEETKVVAESSTKETRGFEKVGGNQGSLFE